MDQITWTHSTETVKAWHRSSESFAYGDPPHIRPGQARAELSIVWADRDRTEPVAANDYDGCWAVIVRDEP